MQQHIATIYSYGWLCQICTCPILNETYMNEAYMNASYLNESYMNASQWLCHIWLSHIWRCGSITHADAFGYRWSHITRERVMSCVNESRHIHISHVTHERAMGRTRAAKSWRLDACGYFSRRLFLRYSLNLLRDSVLGTPYTCVCVCVYVCAREWRLDALRYWWHWLFKGLLIYMYIYLHMYTSIHAYAYMIHTHVCT